MDKILLVNQYGWLELTGLGLEWISKEPGGDPVSLSFQVNTGEAWIPIKNMVSHVFPEGSYRAPLNAAVMEEHINIRFKLSWSAAYIRLGERLYTINNIKPVTRGHSGLLKFQGDIVT